MSDNKRPNDTKLTDTAFNKMQDVCTDIFGGFAKNKVPRADGENAIINAAGLVLAMHHDNKERTAELFNVFETQFKRTAPNADVLEVLAFFRTLGIPLDELLKN